MLQHLVCRTLHTEWQTIAIGIGVLVFFKSSAAFFGAIIAGPGFGIGGRKPMHRFHLCFGIVVAEQHATDPCRIAANSKNQYGRIAEVEKE